MNPRHPRELGATRFFAQVHTFTAECPHCGVVADVRQANQHGATTPAIYDKRTARWRCKACGNVYVVGMLAWPVPRGAGAKGKPDDQTPGPRQLAQLRAEGSGWWLPEELRGRGRLDMSNLTGEADRPPEEDPLDLELALRPPSDPAKDWQIRKLKGEE